jgi:hypothetical protein
LQNEREQMQTKRVLGTIAVGFAMMAAATPAAHAVEAQAVEAQPAAVERTVSAPASWLLGWRFYYRDYPSPDAAWQDCEHMRQFAPPEAWGKPTTCAGTEGVSGPAVDFLYLA